MSMLIFGAIFVDIKGYPLNTYIPKGRNVGRVETVFGGVARNVAEDIANLELRPTFVSLVDDTAQGKEIIEKLKDHKINTRYIKPIKDGTGTWLAVFDNQGDVVASISKRPDLSGITKILNKHGDEMFESCDSVALEIDLDKEIVKQIFDLAEKHHKKVYALVSNMSIALQRRDLITKVACFVCNIQEAEQFFSDDLQEKSIEELCEIIPEKIKVSGIEAMVVTMGGRGAIYADQQGNKGFVPAIKVDVIDTTGAGDAFFAGVAASLTYGKDLETACKTGSKLAASVITTMDAVCPRFNPEEFGFEQK